MDNLSLSPTSFIGRSQELNEICLLLDDSACRLLTLVGPGGIGKTRLAREIAARKGASFPDGIFTVNLAALTQSDDILAAVIEAMPFRFQVDNRDAREQFFDYLYEKRDKRFLLIMDNFEHLLDGASIAADILAHTTALKILATSREALNLQEEWVRQIAGMAYPTQDEATPIEDYSAIQLFVDRARRIDGGFDLNDDRQSVIQICQLVEGMPLAIELAAGWLKTLSPADIVAEIRRNMDILTTRSRNRPERHRSIRSVFSQSWRLMSTGEQAVFQKLSVFRGGFTREAAEVVAGASLNTLAGLVDKSLVRLSASGRYDVHELLRQYGAEQLEAAEQTAIVQRTYIDYYLSMLHRLESEIKAQGQIAALDRVAADFENVCNAWLLALQQNYFGVLRQAVESLHLFGDMRGRYHEAAALLRTAVEQVPSDEEHSAILHSIQARLIRLVLLGNMRIDFDLRMQIDACLAAARARGDQSEVGYCLLVAGIVTCWESDTEHRVNYPQASDYFREGCALYETLDEPFYKAEALVWMASTISDKQESSDCLQASFDLRRKIGDRNGIAWITLNMTEFMLMQLDYAASERYAREAMGLMRDIGSLKGVLQSMFQLAQILALKGELEEAQQFSEEMRELADNVNNLDGKMLSAGLCAFIVCVKDENYAEGVALAQENHELSLEPFFGGHRDMGVHFGKMLAACGLGDYEAVRQSYPAFWEARRDDPAPATILLLLEAAVLAHEGEFTSAVELLGLAFEQPVWASGWLHRWPLLARLRATLETQLGREAYGAAWERGCEADLETALNLILGETPSKIQRTPNEALVDPLSDREIEILRLAADGLSNQQIAHTMVIALGTVKSHLHHIYGKLGIESRTQAIARARELALL